MLEEKKTLEDQLEEAERRRAEAERGRAEGRSEENKICLVGVSFCLNVPSFGGVSTGIFLLGVVLGLVCGCRCDTSRLCSIFNCCCPASARAGSDDIIIVFFCYSNCNYYFYYNHNFFSTAAVLQALVQVPMGWEPTTSTSISTWTTTMILRSNI